MGRQTVKKTYDAVVLGSGLAGLTAALKLRERGCSVAVISKLGPGRASNTGVSMGYFAFPDDEVSYKKHMYETFQAGAWMNDKTVVNEILQSAEISYSFLKKYLHISFIAQKNGFHLGKTRFFFPGYQLINELVKQGRYNGIDFYNFHLPLEITVFNNECRGVFTLDRSYNFNFFSTTNILIATGGFAGAYNPYSDNSPGILGEGLILAWRAGAVLKDLEFIQFYPIGFDQAGLPRFMVPTDYPQNAKLINNQGENILNKYGIEIQGSGDLNKICRNKKGVLSAVIAKEKKQGFQVFLDFSQCQLADMKRLQIIDKNQPWQTIPIKISPMAHFTMGGIEVTPNMESAVTGIFAAGEACAGFHGADSLQGNAVLEAMSSGYLAAVNMGKRINETSDVCHHSEMDLFDSHIKNPLLSLYQEYGAGEETKDVKPPSKIPVLFSSRVKEKMKHTRDKLGSVAINHIGPMRTAQGIYQGLSRINMLYSELINFTPELLKYYNRFPKKFYSLEMTTCLLCFVHQAALEREESRGTHIREDFPQTKGNFNGHIYFNLKSKTNKEN